jgi:hypothetical protein
MFGYSPEEVTAFLYVMWAFLAFVIAVSAGGLMLRTVSKPDLLSKSGLFLVMGILLSWSAEAFNKGWYAWWRVNPTEMWMRDHPAIWFTSMILLTGGIIHFQTFAGKYFGRYAWAFAIAGAYATAAIFMWLT